MKNKIVRPLLAAFAVVFWIGVWWVCSAVINHSYILPDPLSVFFKLGEIILTDGFIDNVLYTMMRVLSGLLLGIVLGIVLGVAAHHSKIVYSLASPIISVIKATPVASIIVILTVMLNGDLIAASIALLMVMPIIWQNVIDAYASIDASLSEVCRVYGFSFGKRMRALYLPAIVKFLFPAIITSVGLAWKSDIAAEIIAATTHSIGQEINDARLEFISEPVFAWTIIVIILSICLEALIKFIIRRLEGWVLR